MRHGTPDRSPGHMYMCMVLTDNFSRFRSKSFVELGSLESSMVDSEITRPVQRSSSWKHSNTNPLPMATSRFDRNSERRKTCLPVMCDSLWRAVRTRQEMPGGVEKDEEGEDKEHEPVVVEVGGEEVELVPGKVWKHTKGWCLFIACKAGFTFM